MSGLTVFFRDFWLQDDSFDAFGENDNYHQSLSSLQKTLPKTTVENSAACNSRQNQALIASKQQQQQQVQNDQQLPGSTQPVEIDCNSNQEVDDNETIPVVSTHNDNYYVRQQLSYESPVDWKEWKQHQQEILTKYMNRRLLNDSDDDSTCNDDNNADSDMEENNIDDEAGMLEMQLESQLETQQENFDDVGGSVGPSDDGGITNRIRDNKKFRKLNYGVPHISETLHSVRYLADIDLNTRTLSLPLTYVEKYWRFRNIRRPACRYAPARKHDLYYDIVQKGMAPPFIRSPYKFCQDDGPMHTCYQHVLSLEVIQSIDPTLTNRHRAESCMNISLEKMDGSVPKHGRVRRIMVFFYNSYAEHIQNILQKSKSSKRQRLENESLYVEGGDKFLLAFENVPALCVFPFPSTDWYDDHDLSRFCLCIGDESGLLQVKDDGDSSHQEAQRVRFDSPDMVIRAAAMDGETGEIVEYRFSPKAYHRKGIDVEPLPHDKSILHDLYLNYNNNKSLPTSRFMSMSNKRTAVVNDQMENNRHSHVIENLSIANAKAIDPVDRGSKDNTTSISPSYQKKNDGMIQRTEVMGPARVLATSNALAVNAFDRNSTIETHKHSQKSIAVHYEMINNLDLVYSERCSRKSSICWVNLYGAVLNFKSPSLTKRGEWMISAVLVDDSLPLTRHDSESNHVHSISVNIFAKSISELPQLRYAGDILRLNRAKLQKWNDELQLLGLRGTTCVVCRGNAVEPLETRDENFVFLPTANSDLNLTNACRNRFRELWRWTCTRLSQHPTINMEHSFRIEDLSSPDRKQIEGRGDIIVSGDTTVMVTAIIEYPSQSSVPDGLPCGFLRVWDGSGVSSSDTLPIDTPSAREAVRDGDPPSRAVMKIAKIIKNLNDPNLSPPKALAGRVANVLVWEKCHWELVREAVQVGSFIRLRNVQDAGIPNSSFRCLQVMSKSSLTPLPDFTYEVLILLEDHCNRLIRQEPFNSESGLLPLNETKDSGINSSSKLKELASASRAPKISHSRFHQTNKQTVLPVQRNVSNYHDFVSGRVGMVFEGYIQVIDLVPTFNQLMRGGINQIIAVNDSGDTTTFSYRFAMRLTEANRFHSPSASLSSKKGGVSNGSKVDAIVANGAGEVIFGMSAKHALENPSAALFNVRGILQDKSTEWVIRAKSVKHQNQKFFLIDSIHKA